MFELILQRIKWMDENGIKQWNKTDYAKVYPEGYYKNQCEKGLIFGLIDKYTGELICAAVLKEEDDRWKEETPAIYLHKFVSKVGRKRVGSTFLRYAEEYARKKERGTLG